MGSALLLSLGAFSDEAMSVYTAAVPLCKIMCIVLRL